MTADTDGYDPDEYYATATKRNLGIVTREEQQRLRQAHVAIAGMGGAGGIYLTTLARMGIGRLSIADFDTFDVVNVNRQAGAMSSTVGRPKVDMMAEIAADIHPGVQVRRFGEGLGEQNVDDFLDGVDLVLDAVDIFALPARRLMYDASRVKGIPVLFGAPPGLSATVGVFMPDGMTFDEYFDLREGMTPLEIMAAFIVGLTPAGTHWRYADMSEVEPSAQAAPSSAAAMSLVAGIVATETLVILLRRRPPMAIPRYAQFDAYLGRYRRGRLRWGNRGPLQRLKRLVLIRKFRHRAEEFNASGFEPLPTPRTTTPAQDIG